MQDLLPKKMEREVCCVCSSCDDAERFRGYSRSLAWFTSGGTRGGWNYVVGFAAKVGYGIFGRLRIVMLGMGTMT